MDSHANMPVVGRNAAIVVDTAKTVNVKPFSSECNELEEVPIVDAVVKWICPVNGTTHLFLIRKSLSVPSMNNNLIPPFIMREAGVIVNDVPKIHVTRPRKGTIAYIFLTRT